MQVGQAIRFRGKIPTAHPKMLIVQQNRTHMDTVGKTHTDYKSRTPNTTMLTTITTMRQQVVVRAHPARMMSLKDTCSRRNRKRQPPVRNRHTITMTITTRMITIRVSTNSPPSMNNRVQANLTATSAGKHKVRGPIKAPANKTKDLISEETEQAQARQHSTLKIHLEAKKCRNQTIISRNQPSSVHLISDND